VSFSEISKSQFFLIAFSFLFSLIYFFTLPFSPYSFDFVFKGTSILLIGVFALSNLKSWTRFFIGFSFLFATTGDVFLTFIHKKYFLFGLCCFLIAHFFYILTFSTLIKKPFFLNSFQKKILILIFFMSIIMFMILRPYLDSLKIPVIIYGLFLTAMAMTATLIKTNNNLILIGSFLFILSDSMIAVGKFIQPFFGEHQLVWITYYTAQLFIPIGIYKRESNLIL
jgi:uncharacterized membrane protein YhhN